VAVAGDFVRASGNIALPPMPGTGRSGHRGAANCRRSAGGRLVQDARREANDGRAVRLESLNGGPAVATMPRRTRHSA